MFNKSLDPQGHIKLAVTDFSKSFDFYSSLLNQIGYREVYKDNNHAGWVSPNGFGLWIAVATVKNHIYRFSAPGLHHFCFKAGSSKQVDDVYEFLVDNNIVVFDKPQKYPEYTSGYYSVFFADPDGIKLELAYY